MIRLFLVFTVLTITQTATQACGFGPLGEDYRIALFNPYLIGQEYELFFFSADKFHSGTNAKAGRDRQRNVDDWARELGGSVTDQQVMELFYGTSFEQWQAAADGQPDSLFRANPTWNAIKNNKDLLDYALWAKEYENPNVELVWWYDEVPSREGRRSDTELHDAAHRGYAHAPVGSFLQRRWAYQLLLQSYYVGDSEEMERMFMAHFRDEDDVLADWARFHFAGQWNAEGKYVVEMANAFRRTPEKAKAAFQRTPNTIHTSDYLGMELTDEERSNLYALAAAKQPGRAMKNIRWAYKFDPSNPVVALLLVREVNKLEDWLLNYQINDTRPVSAAFGKGYEDIWALPDVYTEAGQELLTKNEAADRVYLTELRAFVDELTGQDAQLVRLMRAHLALLDEDYQAALTLVEGQRYADELSRTQAGIIEYLATIQSPNNSRAEVRAAITKHLPELEAAIKTQRIGLDYNARKPYENRRHALARLAARRMEVLGDTVSAFFLYNRSLSSYGDDELLTDWAYYSGIDYLDRNHSDKVFSEIIDQLENEPSTDYNKLLKNGARTQVQNVRDVAGTVALRRGDLNQALAYFEPISEQWYDTTYFFSEYLKRSPFAEPIRNTSEPFPGKAAVVRQMLELQHRAETGDAQACYDLAVAWYQLSDMGNSWMMLNYGHSDYDNPESPLPWPFNAGYEGSPHDATGFAATYHASHALEQLACVTNSANPDKELLAKAAYLRSLIDFHRGEQTVLADYKRYQFHEADLKANRERTLLGWKTKYGNTQFYQTVAGQCAAIREL